jgi:hypothetical protein
MEYSTMYRHASRTQVRLTSSFWESILRGKCSSAQEKKISPVVSTGTLSFFLYQPERRSGPIRPLLKIPQSTFICGKNMTICSVIGISVVSTASLTTRQTRRSPRAAK